MKIVIGSVLKPVDDIRHYLKLARSIAKIPQAEIYIFARDTNYPYPDFPSNIHAEAIASCHVTIFQRLVAPWKFFLKVIKVKPEVIVGCSHDLLAVMMLGKILFGSKTIYDVQENYSKNLQCNKSYNSFISSLLARWIKLKEMCLCTFIDHFWLAEACYVTELPFLNANFSILENKSVFYRRRDAISLSPNTTLPMVFTGTIAKENGVFEAVRLGIALHRLDERYNLTIVGCYHQQHVAAELIKLTEEHSHYISLKISNTPIPYKEIASTIMQASIGILAYHPQDNFKNKIPTKLYEYITAGIPLIVPKNDLWEEISNNFEAAIAIDFDNYLPVKVHEQLMAHIFYPHGNAKAEDFAWDSGENMLTTSITRLGKKT